MTGSNRRKFFKTAGVGAAAVGAAALVPSAVSGTAAGAASAPAIEEDSKLPAGATGSIVAYIDDVSSGRVSVMVEGREVTVTDHQLVAKLAQALHSSSHV